MLGLTAKVSENNVFEGIKNHSKKSPLRRVPKLGF